RAFFYSVPRPPPPPPLFPYTTLFRSTAAVITGGWRTRRRRSARSPFHHCAIRSARSTRPTQPWSATRSPEHRDVLTLIGTIRAALGARCVRLLPLLVSTTAS